MEDVIDAYELKCHFMLYTGEDTRLIVSDDFLYLLSIYLI